MKYLSNTPLAKNQRLKKYLKAMFDKHAFKTRKYILPLIKIRYSKHGLIEGGKGLGPVM
jgi:hypothetical protein